MALEISRTVDGRFADDGSRVLDIETNAGVINCRIHKAAHAQTAVLWVFGSGGGLAALPAACTRAWPASSRPRAGRRSGWTTAGLGI